MISPKCLIAVYLIEVCTMRVHRVKAIQCLKIHLTNSRMVGSVCTHARDRNACTCGLSRACAHMCARPASARVACAAGVGGCCRRAGIPPRV